MNPIESTASEIFTTPQRAQLGRAVWKTVFVVGVTTAILGWGLSTLFSKAREEANVASCNCHLKQFGLALHNYRSTFGAFPPAYTVDAHGRKMHSWRALLLPYFEAETTIEYNFNEPWDGPNNRKQWDKMPKAYRCPSDTTSPPNTTSYVAIVGPETMWPGAESRSTDEMTDGLSSTIAIVEASALAIPWLEPRDLDFSTTSFVVNDPAGTGPSSPHSHGVTVLMADGGAKRLLNKLDPQLLRSLITSAGGEQTYLPY